MNRMRQNGLRRAWPFFIAVAVLSTLAACGKKAGLDPPDETAASYTYPQVYPDPASVLPPDTETPSETKQQLPPPTAGDLSPFPKGRTTTTYQSGPLSGPAQ